MEQVRIAVLGAGLIGKRHAEHIAAEPQAVLAAVVDPSPVGQEVAKALGAPWFASLADLLAADRPDGVIIATPNKLHVEHGLEVVAAGLPAIVEKPIADDAASAARLVEAAEAAGVPLLVGHHRRYNPMIAKAKEVIDSGRLGTIVALHFFFWIMKPDDYYDAEWRRKPGAGPILVNLIHDIDLFRHLCGEVVSVQAQASNAVRGFEVEDSAVILLRFANGALGTVTVSDTAVSPWSWELTASEHPDYPLRDEACCQIAGTHGALAIPQLDLWSYPGARSWWEPLERETVPYEPANPLVVQISHFCAVIRGEAEPFVTGREGLETLKVIEAVKEAAQTGASVPVG